RARVIVESVVLVVEVHVGHRVDVDDRGIVYARGGYPLNTPLLDQIASNDVKIVVIPVVRHARAKFVDQGWRERVSPGEDRTVAVTILGDLPDGWDTINVIQGHSPPTDTTENRIAVVELIVRPRIELIEARKTRGPGELLPEVARLEAGSAKVWGRKERILDFLRNGADSTRRNHIARKRLAGSGVDNRKA